MIDYILSSIPSDDEYIEICKECYNKEPKEIIDYIKESDTDILIDELKSHMWSITFDNYCKAIKYELMLRLDFKEVL